MNFFKFHFYGKKSFSFRDQLNQLVWSNIDRNRCDESIKNQHEAIEVERTYLLVIGTRRCSNYQGPLIRSTVTASKIQIIYYCSSYIYILQFLI